MTARPCFGLRRLRLVDAGAAPGAHDAEEREEDLTRYLSHARIARLPDAMGDALNGCREPIPTTLEESAAGIAHFFHRRAEKYRGQMWDVGRALASKQQQAHYRRNPLREEPCVASLVAWQQWRRCLCLARRSARPTRRRVRRRLVGADT